MTTRQHWLVLAACACTLGNIAAGDDCRTIAGLIAVSKAGSVQTLATAQSRAVPGYRTDLVAAYRSFQLQPKNVPAAERLLRLMPKDETEQLAVITLGDSLCNTESNSEMLALSHIRDGIGLQLAKAVIMAPQHLRSYLEYSVIATRDPHSDYAIRMRNVCRTAHKEFSAALSQLDDNERRRITEQVIDASRCVAIALLEQD